MLSVDPSQDPGGLLTSTWAQGGAALILLGALLWFAWSTILRERKRTDELESREQDRYQWIRDEVVPALVRSTEALSRAASRGSGRS